MCPFVSRNLQGPGRKGVGVAISFLDFQNIRPCVIEEVGWAEARE